MSQQILQVDQAMLETTLDRMVRKSVEETLNAMLDAEADEITGAARYERSGERKAYRAGHYERDLTVKAGRMSVLLQCLFDRFGSVFPQCGLMVFPGVVIVSR